MTDREGVSARAADARESIGVNTSDREPFCALLAARSAVEADARENRGVNPSRAPSIGDLIAVRCERRSALKGMSSALAVAMLGGVGGTLLPRPAAAASAAPASSAPAAGSTLTFPELAHGYDEDHHVAEGYDAQVLIRWGDPVLPDAPPFDAAEPDRRRPGEAVRLQQRLRRLLPAAARLEELGPRPAGRQPRVHQPPADVPGHRRRTRCVDSADRRDQVDVEMAAHGVRVVEIKREATAAGRWSDEPATTAASPRSTPSSSVSGPAAGHDRLKTKADPTGTRGDRHDQQLRRRRDAVGHGADRRGELPPAISAASADAGAEAANYKRCGIAPTARPTPGPRFHDRFDVAKEPNEPNRFGWMVEFDPYDPKSVPMKRTALGRFKHEAATTIAQRRRPGRGLLGRRRALRVRLQVRHRQARSIPPTAPPTATCSTTARSTSPGSTPTAGSPGCRWSSARGR